MMDLENTLDLVFWCVLDIRGVKLEIFKLFHQALAECTCVNNPAIYQMTWSLLLLIDRAPLPTTANWKYYTKTKYFNSTRHLERANDLKTIKYTTNFMAFNSLVMACRKNTLTSNCFRTYHHRKILKLNFDKLSFGRNW